MNFTTANNNQENKILVKNVSKLHASGFAQHLTSLRLNITEQQKHEKRRSENLFQEYAKIITKEKQILFTF